MQYSYIHRARKYTRKALFAYKRGDIFAEATYAGLANHYYWLSTRNDPLW